MKFYEKLFFEVQIETILCQHFVEEKFFIMLLQIVSEKQIRMSKIDKKHTLHRVIT